MIAIISMTLAVMEYRAFYWIAALSIYLFSSIAGFSVGQIAVGFTFIPLTLAIGYTCKWIKTDTHAILFFFAGCVIGWLMVVFVGNWLFYPFTFLFRSSS